MCLSTGSPIPLAREYIETFFIEFNITLSDDDGKVYIYAKQERLLKSENSSAAKKAHVRNLNCCIMVRVYDPNVYV